MGIKIKNIQKSQWDVGFYCFCFGVIFAGVLDLFIGVFPLSGYQVAIIFAILSLLNTLVGLFLKRGRNG